MNGSVIACGGFRRNAPVGAFANGIPGKISTDPGWPMIVAFGKASETVGVTALISATGAARAKGRRVKRARKFMMNE